MFSALKEHLSRRLHLLLVGSLLVLAGCQSFIPDDWPILDKAPIKHKNKGKIRQNRNPYYHPSQKTLSVGLLHLYEHSNLWMHLSEECKIHPTIHISLVQDQIQWYINHQTYLYRSLERATPYLYFVLEEIKRRDLPVELAFLPMMESAYNPFAYSPMGASGMWQLMPRTAQGFGVEHSWWYDGRRDIAASTRAALDYLAYLHELFGNWDLVVAAYNAGEGTLSRVLAKAQTAGIPPEQWWDLDLPEQTRGYLSQWHALIELFSRPNHYGIELPEVNNEPYLGEVSIDRPLKLTKAAQLAGVSVDELRHLNPGINRMLIDPRYHRGLILPLEHIDQFKENLAQSAYQNQEQWQRYVVRRGDTLPKLANQASLKVEDLKTINQLKTIRLKPGQTLLVPQEAGFREAPEETPQERLQEARTNKRKKGTASKNQNTSSVVHYKIKQGDTLISISKKFHVSPKHLQAWNSQAKRKTLKVGSTLVIYPNYNYTK